MITLAELSRELSKTNPFGLTIPIKGKVNADVLEDIVLGIAGSKHFILGYHYSVGININQFLDELFD